MPLPARPEAIWSQISSLTHRLPTLPCSLCSGNRNPHAVTWRYRAKLAPPQGSAPALRLHCVTLTATRLLPSLLRVSADIPQGGPPWLPRLKQYCPLSPTSVLYLFIASAHPDFMPCISIYCPFPCSCQCKVDSIRAGNCLSCLPLTSGTHPHRSLLNTSTD